MENLQLRSVALHKMTNITAGAQTTVQISKIKHHPLNPRRGDIDAIAESLQYHGQFRPVVVQLSTKFILAGNHTVKAARKLGWTTIEAVYVDCDDETAQRILLADNRLNDLSDYDQIALRILLDTLPDLEGTGFTQNDLQELDNIINEPIEPQTDPTSRPDPSADPEVKIGAYRFRVLKLAYEAWNDQLMSEAENRDQARTIIKQRLGIPEPQKNTKTKVETSINSQNETNIEPITAVMPHPDNARQGDIGAIIESLKQFGQYRPIVANKRTRRILVGNHTYQAAVLLGWTHIAISWVDVDEDNEIKILIIDNRTSDLATYDKNDQHLAVSKLLHNLTGTGYNPEDIHDLESGTNTRMPIGKVSIKIGTYPMRIDKQQLGEWSETITHWSEIPERLLIPIEACQQGIIKQ